MSFDIPDFDPFFKGPSSVVAAAGGNTNNKGGVPTIMGGVLDAGGSGGGGRSGGGGSSSSSSSSGVGSTYGGVVRNSSNSESMKNQTLQDLFPESAMSFKTSPKLDTLAFDSNPSMTAPFEPMERMMTHHTSSVPVKQQRGGSSIGVVGSSQLSPQSITAEIEQLDAIANLASSITSLTVGASSSSATSTSNSIPSRTTLRSSGRKVRQPASYAEPSTKSKLRRGDVLFPKVDPVMVPDINDNIVSNNKNGGSDRGAVGRMTTTTPTLATRSESPTTDLDRIMGQIASASSSTSSSPEAK